MKNKQLRTSINVQLRAVVYKNNYATLWSAEVFAGSYLLNAKHYFENEKEAIAWVSNKYELLPVKYNEQIAEG